MTNEEYMENMLQLSSANYIQLCRIYDALCLLLPEDKALNLREYHEQGKTFAPPPYLEDSDE